MKASQKILQWMNDLSNGCMIQIFVEATVILRPNLTATAKAAFFSANQILIHFDSAVARSLKESNPMWLQMKQKGYRDFFGGLLSRVGLKNKLKSNSW